MTKEGDEAEMSSRRYVFGLRMKFDIRVIITP